MEEHQPAGGTLERTAGSPGGDDALADPRALQILTTEHWSLLSARSLAYNEAFSRAGMFLTFLSASLIVMGFLLASDSFRPVVVPVIAILLSVDLFVGAATLGRMVGASVEELHAVRGMNRIRHAYRDMVPGLEPYFVSGFHDDARGVLAFYGAAPMDRSMLRNVAHGVTTTIGMVGTTLAFIFGALVGVLTIAAKVDTGLAIPFGVVASIVAFITIALAGQRAALRNQARASARFPTPD